MYQYPYGNAQQLNLDWILSKLQELESGSGGGADLEEVANALVSASFDATIPYRKYDYAFYDGKLYRALNDTIGAFNPADWMEVTLGADIPVLTRLVNADSALLTTLQNKVNNLGSDDVANESTVTGNTVSDALGTLNGAINAKTDYLDIGTIPGTAVTREEAITEAFNRINIYDKPIVIKFYWSGYWSGIAYKYTDGLYGTIYATFPVNNASYFGYMSNGTMHIVSVATDDTLSNLKQVNTSYFGTGNALVIDANGYVVNVHTQSVISITELIGATIISDATLRPKTKILSQAVLREIGVGYRSALAFLNENGTITLNDPDSGTQILDNSKYDYAIIDYSYPKK